MQILGSIKSQPTPKALARPYKGSSHFQWNLTFLLSFFILGKSEKSLVSFARNLPGPGSEL